MADLQTSTWSETAASNNAATPDGWPEGQSYASVNDCAREMMGALKREWNRSHLTQSTGGTSTAITITYTTAPTLVLGLELTAKITTTCGTNPTLNVNALGARKLYVIVAGTARQLYAGELVAGESARFIYDTALDGGSGGWIVDRTAAAPAFPNTTSGAVGEVVNISVGAPSSVILPAGGLWAYSVAQYVSGVFNNQASGVAVGGSTVLAGSAGVTFGGFCWRIA